MECFMVGIAAGILFMVHGIWFMVGRFNLITFIKKNGFQV